MKTMNRMRMQDCWCYSCMMAMAMKGSVMSHSNCEPHHKRSYYVSTASWMTSPANIKPKMAVM